MMGFDEATSDIIIISTLVKHEKCSNVYRIAPRNRTVPKSPIKTAIRPERNGKTQVLPTKTMDLDLLDKRTKIFLIAQV